VTEICYDTLDQHLMLAGDLTHAVVPMGMLLGWCANMHLLSREFQQENEQAILQVRMREVRGSELLVLGGGDLRRDMFNEAGQKFLDIYYDEYRADFGELFAAPYTVEENWDNYSSMAKVVTRKYMHSIGHKQRGPGLLGRLLWWKK
jgi:hypothetical protein